MSYLLSISIGPVQDFIASARRSRDLWFGSYLLSEISKVVAQTIGEDTLIFPENLSGNTINKILAIVPKIEYDFDEQLKEAISDRLADIYNQIFSDIEKNLSISGLSTNVFKKDATIEQIKDMYEIYWAAIPFDKSNYKSCREKVEILLNARKATRDFKKVTWASNAPKSSLDGNRESVILDELIENEKIQKIFKLRNTERLCGVGVLKRLGEEQLANKFSSTSHIASLPFITGAGEENFKDYAENLEKIAERNSGFKGQDGQIIYKSRLKDFISEDNSENAKNLLDAFLDKNPNSKTPLPYFALLQADGDRMGRVIDNQENENEHRELSRALSSFANDVKTIVENYRGCLIYSGGDDVLAMLPLHTVLECARELADNFYASLSKNEKFKDADGNFPTLSAGIAVVHHTEPLQTSLETMRNAEKEAKKIKDKNALAIILSKRSGADTTIKGSWADDRNTGKSFDERLKWLIQLHLDDALPDGVAYELRDLWLRFCDETGRVSFRFENLLRDESLRILKRKKSEGGVKENDKTIFDGFREILNKAAFCDRGSNKAEWTLADLANEIIVARDFARAYKQAGIKKVGGIE